MPDKPNIEGWIIHGGERCTQHAEGKNPPPKSGEYYSELILGRKMVVDSVPFQSEFEEPNPTRLRVQSLSKGRKHIADIGIRLNFQLKFSEGPQ